MSSQLSQVNTSLDHLLLDLYRRSGDSRRTAGALELAWRAAAGSFLARHSRPLELAEGTLRVGADSVSIKAELERLEGELCVRLRKSEDHEIKTIQVEVVQLERRARLPDPNETLEPPSEALLLEADDLPPVREELRPIIHRILALHRRRR